jgi:hypothetical protein
MCARHPSAAGHGVVVGRALLPDGSPAGSAQIEAGLVVAGNLQALGKDKTDNRGLFHICNVPIGSKLEVRVERDSRSGTQSASDVHDVTRTVQALRLTLHAMPQ